MKIARGITRTVLVGDRWAVKLPSWEHRMLVRGWLANRSEWRNRKRRDVARPLATLFHIALVMPAADFTGDAPHERCEPGTALCEPWLDRAGDEAKPCSWGWFGDRWRLVDYDRAWEVGDRGLVGGLYYWRQERRARRWTRLPEG